MDTVNTFRERQTTAVDKQKEVNREEQDIDLATPFVHKHCHDFDADEDPEVRKRSARKLLIACILAFCFMLCEVTGGIIANSLAIATDGAHLMTDFMAFGINLISLKVATRKPTARLNFGWYRIEVLGALLSVLLLWIVTGVLIYLSICRMLDQSYHIDPTIMLIMASLGLVFNIIQSLNLGGAHGHGHGHSHGGHDHQESNQQSKSKSLENGTLLTTSKAPSYDSVADTGGRFGAEGEGAELHPGENKTANQKEESINVRAALLHVLGDLAQSLMVLTASLILYFRPHWTLVDPICTFTFAFVVGCTSSYIIKDVVIILLEGTPSSLDFENIQRQLASIPGVKHVHDLHLWAMTSQKTCATAHLALEDDSKADPFKVVSDAELILKGNHHIQYVTIQTEKFYERMNSCQQCTLTNKDI